MKIFKFLSKIMLYTGASVFCSVSLYGAVDADLSITQTPSATIVNQSTVMTYTLVVTNNDGQTSPDATVSDTLPIGMTYNSSSISSTSASTAAWSCTATGSPVVVQCSTTSLWKNSSSTITLNVTAPTSAVSGAVTFSNTATVSSTVADPASANNSASSTVTLNRPPVAVNDSVSTASHTAVSGNVLTNDTDLDGHATISVVNPGTFTLSFGALTINANGSYTYTPGYFTGETDHYDYTIIDSNGVTASATLQINIGSACTDTGNNNTDRNFCLRKQTVLFGDMVTVGNTVIVPPNPQPDSDTNKLTYCNSYTTGPFSTDTSNIDNQGSYLCSYRPDGYLNATSAEVITSPNGKIKWAGLYLQGVVKSSDTASLSSMDVKIKKDSGSYVSAGVPTVINHKSYVTTNSTDYDNYSAFIDVTQIVTSQNWQGGVYTVANVPVTTDALVGDTQVIGKYGAWTLVVIYEDANLPLKSVSIYDGWKKITGTDSSSSATINVGNFYTPATGTIDSEVSIFVGEGDKYRHGDHFYGWVPGGLPGKNLGTADNAFDSGIVSTGTRTPSLTNNQGIDIKTYQIGNGTDQLLSNSDNNISFKFSTNGDIDYHYPSMLAFSTEVYHPRMCYYENLYSTSGLLSTGSQVPQGSPIHVKVLLKNDMQEPAEKVMLYRTFASTLPYTSNSTGYKLDPVAITDTTTPVTDVLSSTDIFDYSTPLSLFSLHAGSGATYNQGGDFINNQTALFDYNTTANFEGNTSITYQIAYTMPTIGFRYEGELAKCVDFNNTFGVIPSTPPQLMLGDFNVVYADHANGALSSGYYYNLPTQITSRADHYKVIALQSGTNILEDINASVAVELVDADSSNVCSERTVLSHNKTWTTFFDQSTTNFSANDIIDGMMIYDADAAKKYYQKAAKNAAFRIKYPPTDSGGLITFTTDANGKLHLKDFPSYAGDTCVVPVTATTYNPANGNPQGEHTYTQVPEACGNSGSGGSNSGMTEHEMHVCLECIMGANPPSVCSKDTFAIRPEAFSLKLYDQNQTNSAVKQFMMNNTPSPANKDMASGYRYYTEVNATNHLGNASSLNYNTTENIDFIWSSTQTGCNDDTNKSISFSFANGLADGNVSVDQVGEYRLSIIDTAWTAVDSNTSLMSHHIAPYFMVGIDTDCASNSAVSSAVKTTGIGSSPVLNGCNISTNHTNDIVGVTYTDSDVTFYPYKFDMSTINFGVGTLPQEINATSGPDFVYMSDMSRTDSMNMSLRATGAISARGENNSTLSNFVNNCYAVNTNLSMNTYNTITLANTTYQVRFVDTNGSGTVYDSNATDLATGALTIPLMTLDDGNFTKDMSGSLNTVTRLNYDRNQTTPLDPMTVQYGELGFKCVTASECTMQADLSASHEAIGSKAMDFNVTHAYGRIIPRDVRVFGNVGFTANAWYEVFNTPVLAGTGLAPSRNAPQWFINQLHNDSNDGDGSVTVVTTSTNSALPIIFTSNATGVETYTFSAETPTYSGKAHINTDPWLWYGINALGYADPGMNEDGTTDGTVDSDDCLHHPCFNINVVPAVGATGSAKSGASDKKASKKSDSGEGTWKSTTDYAPAIR